MCGLRHGCLLAISLPIHYSEIAPEGRGIRRPAALRRPRLRLPLLAGQPVHPLDRTLTLADFPNGFGNSVPFDRYAYINPDLTVSLHRLPEDEWVLLDAAMHPRASGHGTASGPLLDRQGVLGTTTQSLLISPR